MRCRIFIIVFSLLFIGFQLFNNTLALEKQLITKGANLEDVKGKFNLILYGARHIDDLETLAILDVEGDNYVFEPFAPDFDYKILKNLTAEQALDNAKKFIGFHNAYHKSVLKRILDYNGRTIGFEMRPLYYPFVYGFADVMDVFYFLKENGKVKVVIRLIEQIDRLRFPGGDGTGGDGGGGS